MDLTKEEVYVLFTKPENVIYMKGSPMKSVEFYPEVLERLDIPEAGEFVCPFHPILTEGTDDERRVFLDKLNINAHWDLLKTLKAEQEFEKCETLRNLIGEYYRLFPNRS